MTEPALSTPNQRPQIAVSAAIFRGAELLLVRRARSPGKGFYSLPGGRVEYGESLAEALMREIAEETALAVDIVALAGWREVLPGADNPGHYVIMSFAARWRASEPVLNEELDDFRWVLPGAIGELKVTAGLSDIVQAARAMIGA